MVYITPLQSTMRRHLSASPTKRPLTNLFPFLKFLLTTTTSTAGTAVTVHSNTVTGSRVCISIVKMCPRQPLLPYNQLVTPEVTPDGILVFLRGEKRRGYRAVVTQDALTHIYKYIHIYLMTDENEDQSLKRHRIRNFLRPTNMLISRSTFFNSRDIHRYI